MGSCFSSEYSQTSQSESASPQTAQVVSIHGDLHKYNLPIFVSQVLQAQNIAASSSSIFLCNSDRLSYDEYIPALDPDHQLVANQIYFVLPVSKLKNRLSSSDMAALAVKASVAIQNDFKKDSHRRKKARISPVSLVAESLPLVYKDKDEASTPMLTAASSESEFETKHSSSSAKPQPGFSRSASIRKLQRYTSRRAKLAVRSFKLRLSTIYEGSVL